MTDAPLIILGVIALLALTFAAGVVFAVLYRN